MQSNILKTLSEEINCGRAAVLVTVVSTRGSTPRKVGSQMIVFQDGSIFGTIGGGQAEGLSISEAKKAFKSEKSTLHKMTMNASVAASEGMACGGDMEIFIQHINGASKLI